MPYHHMLYRVMETKRVDREEKSAQDLEILWIIRAAQEGK